MKNFKKAKKVILFAMIITTSMLMLAPPAYCNLADDIADKFKGVMKWFAETLLVHKFAGFFAKIMFTLKEVAIILSDKLFTYVQTFIVKIWDFTDAKNIGEDAIGVGAQAAGMMTGKISYMFIAIAGVLIYFFAMQGALAFLLAGDNPVKALTSAGFAIALLIVYPLIYSFIINGSAKLAMLTLSVGTEYKKQVEKSIGTVTGKDIKTSNSGVISIRDLTDNLSAGIGGEEMMDKFGRGAEPQWKDFEENGLKVQFWLNIISQMIVAIISIFYMIEILFLKGQQIVAIVLAYFLGILAIIMIATPSLADSFKKWVIGFVNTCLYSFYWALILMVLYILSGAVLANVDSTVRAVLIMFAMFGGFQLMTRVGTIASTLAVGKELVKGSASEFRNRMMQASSVVKTATVGSAAVAGASALAGVGLAAGGASALTGAKTPRMNLGSVFGRSGAAVDGIFNRSTKAGSIASDYGVKGGQGANVMTNKGLDKLSSMHQKGNQTLKGIRDSFNDFSNFGGGPGAGTGSGPNRIG